MSTPRPRAPERASTLSAPTVLLRLARHLRASAPQVPIARLLLSQLDELVRDLRHGNIVSAEYGLWDEIFEATLGDEGNPRPLTCGAPLLRFAGYLGDALREFGARRIPPTVAVAMMTELEVEPRQLVYAQVSGRAYLEGMPQGVDQLGGAVRLPLPLMPVGDGPRDVFAAFFEAL